MNPSTINKLNSYRRLQRNVLALAIASSAGFAGLAFAQSTSGSLSGSVPMQAGETVSVTSSSGITRETSVDAKGRYSFPSLPLGKYTVSLKQDGKVVDTRNNISLVVGGTSVDFQDKQAAQALATVTVVGSSAPPIDVSSTDVRTVITADQLAKLPLARSAEAIALLAPGVTPGYTGFQGPLGNSLDSFGGSSVTENAYYVNGFNTTDPLSGFGGITLPYGAIDQQEILTGGYGAQYGRSDGGVISQNGKRGTNEWHFGFQELFTPSWARGDDRDIYYVNGTNKGQIYDRRSGNKQESFVTDAYVGGPLIKDKLFFFLAAETSRQYGNSITQVGAPYNTQYSYNDPKLYAKLDWNINDSNILELTHASNKNFYQGADNAYDYDSRATGAYSTAANSTATKADIDVLKYTSYITDDLTASLLLGKQKIKYFNEYPGAGADSPYIGTTANQDPAITGGAQITGNNPAATQNNPDHSSLNTNLRFDLSYKLGDHTISAGIDNQNSHDINDGTTTTGPGYAWYYGKGVAGKDISAFVGAPTNGYYAYKYVYSTAASVRVKQRAWYLQDNWQVTDRVLVNAGIRDDAFTNYNPSGEAFLRLTKPQWAPRIGASWDVNGDSSFKVFANAGRYFLAMPASVALRAAASSLYSKAYYNYTAIDANGIPTGLSSIPSVDGEVYYVNGENGKVPDAKTVAAANIKSEYQDEYMLGFQHDLTMLDTSWVYGAKAQVRKLRNILDDICDTGTIADQAVAQGFNDVDADKMNGCYLSNPGRSNTYRLVNTSGGYDVVNVTAGEFGDPKPKRNYYAMELFLEHPFDGKWYGKIDYLWSRSLGNTEGQVRSDIGQADVAATEDWDYGQLEQYVGGDLANDRRHQLKAYGSYQITPEWMVSGSLMLLSGTPKSCLGYYGPGETDPIGYGDGYHWCGGEPSRPGDAGRTPWQHILSLTAEYRPAFADHKLAFNVMVYNLLNESVPTSYYATYGYKDAMDTNYMRAQYWSTPRYLRLGVTYDF